MHRLFSVVALALAWVAFAAPSSAQEANRSAAQEPRRLAPGVLTVIPPSPVAGDTYSGPQPLVEIVQGLPELDWTPNYIAKSQTLYEMARNATLRREIWNLEFAFKPVRMIQVDVPQPEGNLERKLVWYIVYRVRNVGADLRPVPTPDASGNVTYTSEPVSYDTRRFFPHFLLESHEFNKQYLDQVIPAAQEAIQQRERPGVKLHNSVEISQVPIPLSTDRTERGVWGVAMWTDVDPQIDFFSIYVQGLTNAYRFQDPEGAFQPGDPPGTGRELQLKTLQLNFWRPGDAVHQHEEEIHYGVPYFSNPAEQAEVLQKYGLEERVDYRWVYR